MKCNAFGLERSRDFRVVRDLDSLCVVTVQNLEQIGLTLEYLSALYISHREQTYRSIVWHLFSKKKKKKKKKTALRCSDSDWCANLEQLNLRFEASTITK